MAKETVLHYDEREIGAQRMRPLCHMKYDSGMLTSNPLKVTCKRCLRRGLMIFEERHRRFLIQNWLHGGKL